MIYKRATRAVKNAGIENIVIVKRLWWPAPSDTRAHNQSSRCFNTWQEAAQAVIDGYRPTVHEFLPGKEPGKEPA